MEGYETANELKEHVNDQMQYPIPAEELILFRTKRKDREWFKTRDSDYQLLKAGDTPSEVWDVLNKAGNVMDAHSMVRKEEFGFRGVFDLRPFEIHVFALLSQYRERSKGRLICVGLRCLFNYL